MAFISWYRNDVGDVQDFALLSDDPETAGGEIRTFLSTNEGDILSTDTILMSGTADFGDTFTLLLPPAIYRGSTAAEGYDPARWLTHTIIDGIVGGGDPEDIINQADWDKKSSTAGFTFTSYVRFENFYLGGNCSNIYEDGGLLGWNRDYTGAGIAEFHNCEIDASEGMDWAIYSWENNATTRRVVITDSIIRFCRFGVALGGYGSCWQSAELTRVSGIGDANGSRSQGDSSGPGDPPDDVGGVLTMVYNRGSSASSGDGPYIKMTDCTSTCTGLDELYDNGAWGCPRIAALCTNAYDFGLSGGTYKTNHTTLLIRCNYSITPGVSEEVYDIDIRERSGVPYIKELGAMPAPAEYPNVTLWQPTPSELLWLGAIDSSAHPTAVDDLIQNAETLVDSRILTQATANLRPKWKGNGWMWFGTDNAVVRRIAESSSNRSFLNHVHEDGTAHFLLRIKLDAIDSNFKTAVANCRMTSNHRGFGLRVSSASVFGLHLYDGTATSTPFFSINAGTISDTKEHVAEFILAAGPSACKARLDWGSWTTGTISGLTAGNSTDDLVIGCRANALLDPFNGQIRDLVIASEQLDDEYVSNWRYRVISRGRNRLRIGTGIGL